MAKLSFEIITGERVVLEASGVDMVVAPGVEGALGILPGHAPLVTTLQPGELRVKQGAVESALAVGGGFLEVAGDRVLVLADAAERAEEIDVARAEDARRRAQEALADSRERQDMTLVQAEAALRRSLVRLRVARRRAAGSASVGMGGPPPGTG
ncbi:MAG: F0F1 ATP synthase subunit epsilon [Chloroflexi bacterium]|nr:F0F1 ATP synthase subunit epsilon [Chloroflexota bacterium]